MVARHAFEVGKLAELVVPVRYAFPDESTAMALALSSPEPPRYVEYESLGSTQSGAVATSFGGNTRGGSSARGTCPVEVRRMRPRSAPGSAVRSTSSWPPSPCQASATPG